MNSKIQEFSVVALGRLILALFGFFSLKISSALLGESNFGLLLILLAFQSLYSLVLISPIGNYLNNIFFAKEDRSIVVVNLRWLRRYTLSFSVILAILATVYIQKFLHVPSNSYLLAFSITAYCVFLSWNNNLANLLNLNLCRAESAIYSLVQQVLAFFLAFALYSINNTVLFWLLGLSLGNLIWFLIAYQWSHGLISKENPRKLQISNIKYSEIIKFSAPLSASAILVWFQSAGYRLVWNPILVASISICLSISSQIFSILDSVLSQYFYPYFYKNSFEGSNINSNQSLYQKSRSFSSLINVVLPIYLVITAILLLVSENIYRFIVPASFSSSFAILQIGFLIELLRILNNTFNLASIVQSKTFYPLVPAFIGSVVLIIFMIKFPNPNPAVYAVLILLASSFVRALTSYAISAYNLQFMLTDYPVWILSITIFILGLASAANHTIVSSYYYLGSIFVLTLCFLLKLWGSLSSGKAKL